MRRRLLAAAGLRLVMLVLAPRRKTRKGSAKVPAHEARRAASPQTILEATEKKPTC